MRKHLSQLVVGLLCVCCMGLVACGGSSGSSTASGSANASTPESASAASSSEAPSSSEASASTSAEASSATSGEVSPELKEAAEKLVAVADQAVALAERGKAEGYEAIEAEWDKLSKQINEATDALRPWANKLAEGTMSDVDMSFYRDVIMPAASKSAQAGLDIIDLIEI